MQPLMAMLLEQHKVALTSSIAREEQLKKTVRLEVERNQDEQQRQLAEKLQVQQNQVDLLIMRYNALLQYLNAQVSTSTPPNPLITLLTPLSNSDVSHEAYPSDLSLGSLGSVASSAASSRRGSNTVPGQSFVIVETQTVETTIVGATDLNDQ